MTKNNKILIAEDNPFLAKLTSNHLKGEGFDIDVAEDGEQTLDKMKKSNYAMLLLDLIMPNKDGFEVL
ncbi:response regulator, partial [Patescibacteria group bacterium]|nr:response regulator [Patescibacteria group bacterium]